MLSQFFINIAHLFLLLSIAGGHEKAARTKGFALAEKAGAPETNI
jgi:hypothetical protein